MKVYIFLAEGFEEIEAITVVDVLRRAKIDIKTVSVSERKEVTGAHGIMVNADILFDSESQKAGDMYILPGGMPGTANLAAHQELGLLLKDSHNEDKWLAAICAAPMVFGKLGLLSGKAATCYPGFEKDLLGAECRTETVVQAGKIVTSRGPGTAIEFSLKLVELLKGAELANNIKKGMLV
jgi:protein deglycase